MMKSPSEQVDPNLNSMNQINPGRRMSWQGQYQMNPGHQPPHHQPPDGPATGHSQYFPEKMDMYGNPPSNFPVSAAGPVGAGVEPWQGPPSSGLGPSQYSQAEASPAYSANSHYGMEHRDMSNASVNSNGMSGAAAAAAAAMAAAAHTAKGSPGYPKPANSISPHVNAVHKPPPMPVAQRGQPFHPNYVNVQSGPQPPNVTPAPSDPSIQNHSYPPPPPQGPHPMNRPPNPSQYPPWNSPQPNSMDHRPSPGYQHGFEGQPMPTTERVPSYASDSISGPMSNASSHDSEESRTKSVSARSSSQKISALYEPDEPGRKEFIDSVLKYWEDMSLPLKHAPMMGGRTLDLFTLYQHVRSRGFMQEVTRSKQWTEISSAMGLGSTSATGFTLKKQYCKYLYGYECRTERQEQEPPEALSRVTEASRKKKSLAEQSQMKANDNSHYGEMPPNMMHHQHPMTRPPIQQHHPGHMGYHQQQMPGYHHGYHGHSVHNQMPGSYEQPPYGGPPMNSSWQQNPHYPPNRPPMPQQRYPYRTNGLPPPQTGPPLPPPQAYPNMQPRGRPPSQPPFNQPYQNQPAIHHHSDVPREVKSPSIRNMAPKPMPPVNMMDNHTMPSTVKIPPTESAPDGAPIANTSQPVTGFNSVPSTTGPMEDVNNNNPEASSVHANATASQPLPAPTIPSGKPNDKQLMNMMQNTPNQGMMRSNTPKDSDIINSVSTHMPRPDFKGSPLRHALEPNAHKMNDPGMRPPGPGPYYSGSKSIGQEGYMPRSPYLPPQRGPERAPGSQGMYQSPHSYHQSYSPYGGNTQMNVIRQYGHKRLPNMENFGPPSKMPRPFSGMDRRGRSYPPRPDMGSPYHPPYSQHQIPGVRQYQQPSQHPSQPHSQRQVHMPPMNRNESPLSSVTSDPHKSRTQIAHPPESASNFLKGLVGGTSMRSITGYHASSHYPQGCVETMMPVGGKFKEKSGRDVGVVEAWQIIMSLKSGLHAESTWALNALTVLLHDNLTVRQVILSQLPGLLNLIIEHYRFCLHELFGISAFHPMTDGEKKATANDDDPNYSDAEQLTTNMAIKCQSSPSTLNLGEKEHKYSTAPAKLLSPYCKLPVKVVAGDNKFPLLLDQIWKDEKKPDVHEFLPLSGRKGETSKEPTFRTDVQNNLTSHRAEMTFEDMLSIPSSVCCKEQNNVLPLDTDSSINENGSKGDSISKENGSRGTSKDSQDKMDTNDENCSESDANSLDDKQKISVKNGNASHVESCLKRFSWNCDVVLLEEEAAGFPGSVGFKAPAGMNSWHIASRGLENVFPKQPKDSELVMRVLCLSNIVRSLSCVFANHNELSMHQTFFFSLCGTLLLGHKHRIRYIKSSEGGVVECKYNFDEAKPLNGCVNNSDHDGSSALSKEIDTDNANEIKHTCQHNDNAEMSQNTDSISTANEKSVIENNVESEKHDVKQDTLLDSDDSKIQKPSHQSAGLDEDDIYRDPWWWDCVRQLRQDSLVILANLSTTLNLSLLPDDGTILAILDACLHWSVCPSADARDPSPTVSAQSLGIEILTKLSMKDDNVDLILATRPYSRLEKLYKTLIIMLGNRQNQVLREFSIVLLCNLCVEETAARSIALQTGAVSNFLSFLEECEETGLRNQRVFTAGQEKINCGTVPYMMKKCAMALFKMAELEDNRPLFLKHHLRIVSLSMSMLLGSAVQSLISAVLFELSRKSPKR